MTSGESHIVILGAGTAGTMAANKLRRALDRQVAKITVIAQNDIHDYQPGYLFMPFSKNTPAQIRKTSRQFLPSGVDFVISAIEQVHPEEKRVDLENGTSVTYDHLIIATGTTPRPDQTPGMLGPQWGKKVGEFYSFEGALTLRKQLNDFTGGRLVVQICEIPIKCPVAPLEFVFLADEFLVKKGLRQNTDLVYVTPFDGAFTKPVASQHLSGMLQDRGIRVESDFMIESVDQEASVIRSYDEREIAYDLLVTVPVNMGADYIARSGLGDELNYVPVDKHTNQSLAHPSIFALGDASNLPTSKAGSVAHFSVDVFTENFVDHFHGRPMRHQFDGHANCFVETGYGKALLLDFNYDTEPLTGTFPFPGVGPLTLLGESRLNHLGKLAFRSVYWNMLLPGRPLGLPAAMSVRGKNLPAEQKG